MPFIPTDHTDPELERSLEIRLFASCRGGGVGESILLIWATFYVVGFLINGKE